MPGPLYLRVDVCTFHALADGVPGVLDALRRARARATFFLTFGPDASGRALKNLTRPGFLAKMARTNAPAMYGLRTAFYGTLLPAPLVGAGLPDRVRRIRDEGHEIGLHGWDHRRWQDELDALPYGRLRDDFRRMHDSFAAILGEAATCFAAPAWRVSRDLLALEEEAGLAFASDARGLHPFLPVFEGRAYAVPQLPVTLPTLDELLGRLPRADLVDAIAARAAAQPDYACFTAHAEAEGRAFRAEFEALLRRFDRPIEPLGAAPRRELPRCPLTLGPLPGRDGVVALQQR